MPSTLSSADMPASQQVMLPSTLASFCLHRFVCRMNSCFMCFTDINQLLVEIGTGFSADKNIIWANATSRPYACRDLASQDRPFQHTLAVSVSLGSILSTNICSLWACAQCAQIGQVNLRADIDDRMAGILVRPCQMTCMAACLVPVVGAS